MRMRMKQKTNYTEKIKNKQTTTTTKNTKTRTHRMQNIMRITSAIVLQPVFNAYIFKGSTNFQCLYFQRFNQFSKLIEKSSPTFFFSPFLFSNNACVRAVIWGGSRGGSGGSVEPPKLNVKTYNKRVVKKSEPTQLINISFENDISLSLCTRKQQ